jgi:hypothetical protein
MYISLVNKDNRFEERWEEDGMLHRDNNEPARIVHLSPSSTKHKERWVHGNFVNYDIPLPDDNIFSRTYYDGCKLFSMKEGVHLENIGEDEYRIFIFLDSSSVHTLVRSIKILYTDTFIEASFDDEKGVHNHHGWKDVSIRHISPTTLGCRSHIHRATTLV